MGAVQKGGFEDALTTQRTYLQFVPKSEFGPQIVLEVLEMFADGTGCFTRKKSWILFCKLKFSFVLKWPKAEA